MKRLLLIITTLFYLCSCTAVENEYLVTIVYSINGGEAITETIDIRLPDGNIPNYIYQEEDVNFKIRKAYMEGLIDNNIPLPSGLDEAAFEYANKEYPDEAAVGQWGTGDYEPPVDMEYPREIAKDAFKTGVEWHARQGVTKDSVVWQDSDDGLYVEMFLDKSKFKMADAVRIQVYKIE